MTWNTLPPGARRLFYLQAWARLVLFWIPATGAGVAFLSSAWSLKGALFAGAGWLLLQLLLTLWMPALEHAHYAWAERDHDLLVARGVFVRTVTAVPARRIQHVDVRQGVLERMLGLARLLVYTASGAGADGVIPGLTLESAEALRDRLVSVGGDDGV